MGGFFEKYAKNVKRFVFDDSMNILKLEEKILEFVSADVDIIIDSTFLDYYNPEDFQELEKISIANENKYLFLSI